VSPIAFIKSRVAKGTELVADEAVWNTLGASYEMRRIDHEYPPSAL
jgi:hypothetical protein